MKRQKRNLQRALSLALSVLLVFGDGSLLKVSAAERTVSGSDVLTEQTDTGRETGQKEEAGQERNRLPASGTEERAADRLSVSMGDMTVSGNKPVRAPEAFHTEPAPEDYGTLAAYDEYSRTYHVDGSQYVTVIGNDGATYLEEDGSLQPVDNTLVENPVSAFSSIASGDSFVNSANDYTVVLPGTMSAAGEEIRGGAGTQTNGSQGSAGTVSGNENAGSDTATVSGNQPWQQTQAPVFTGDSIVIDNGTHMLSLRPTEGLFAQGVVKDNAIRYNNVFENIDFQYTVLGNAVKEDIILLAPTVRNSFSYLLDTCGLPAKIENNTLYVTDGEETAFVLEAPEMEDAAGEISFGVKMELTEQDGFYLVTVTADQDWLCAPERVYPVRIDPTAIQVTKNAIHVACAEEGSPNSVIGDNQYPYVGYDDGITSGNLAGFGSKHLNCRSYFAIDYDFSALAAEAEIKTAAFQVTQKTRWSRGTSEFGLYGVEEEWAVKKLTWNSQTGYTHYFLDSQTATAQRGVSLTYDVTEEVSGWINGTGENHGLVMKAMVEAPNEAAAAAAGVKMQSEVFYNNSSASYAPKLIISWTGELTDLDGLTLDDTTIDIYPVVERNGDKSCNTLGVAAHGLAKPGSTVHYQLINGTTGEVEAAKSLKYPDSSEYAGAFPTALEYKRRLSNWQSEVFDNLTPGQEYYVTAYAEGLLTAPSIPGNAAGTAPGAGGVMGVGATVTSDTFIIYEESALDLIPRIVEHYGVDLNTVMADNRMQDCLTKEGNRIFIRNPRNTAPYTSGNFSEYYRAMIDGLLLGRAENCVFGYEPVNLNTGNFYMEQSDAAIPDIGGDFALSRRYNSKGAAYRGSLGYGWSFAYDESLGELEDGSVVWLKNDGSIVTFTKDGEGYQAPAGCDVSLTEKEDGWVLTESASGLEHAFNLYGLLTGLTDLYGNVTALAYDMDFNLLHITSPSGKQFQVSLDGEKRISSVTLPDGYGVSYAYDEAGNLVQVTDPAGGMRTYMYDDAHRMTGWVDENGHQVIGNVYDSEGRVVSQTDANGEVITLAYEEGQTVSTDAEGGVTAYAYDDSNRLVSSTDPNGGVTAFTYEGACVTSMTDPEGGVWSYTYDAMNRQTGVTNPLGGTSAKAYNLKGWCVAETDEAGAVTSYAFDKAGNVLSVTDKEGQTSTFTYDKKNQMLSGRDPLGNVLAYTYDRNGNKRMEWDAEGQEIKYEYDSLNRLVSQTDPEGQVITFTYNGHDQVTGKTDRRGFTERTAYDNVKSTASSVTDKRGNVTVYETDACGRTTKVTYADGSMVSYGYDQLGRLERVTDQLGTTTQLSYDKNGNLISIQDDASRVYTYAYDRLNRLVKTTDPLGHTVTYAYDALGNVTAVTDGRGNTTSYAYDAVSRLTEVMDALEGRSAYTYDKEDRVLTAAAPGGEQIAYTYDAIGQLLGVTDALGGVTTYTYDGVSRLTSVTDALMGVTAYTYDKNGSLLTRTDALGNAHSYQVNAEGSLLTDRYPNGEKESYTYDANGNVLTCTDRYGVVTTFTYDAMNRITRAEDTAGNVMEYTYGCSELGLIFVESSLKEHILPNPILGTCIVKKENKALVYVLC